MNLMYELKEKMTTSVSRVLIQFLFSYFIQIKLILVLMLNILITWVSKSEWYVFSGKPNPAWFERDVFNMYV